MRNLVISGRKVKRLWNNDEKQEKLKNLCVAFSADCPELLFACRDLQLLQYDADGNEKTLVNILDQIPTATNSQILDLYFFSIQRLLSVFLTTGEILSVNVDTLEVHTGETCLEGIKAVGVSPDQELIVVISVNNKILLLTYTFSIINETDLHSASFGEGEFITVGWGKKETQFHGSEGKEAARKKTEFESNVDLESNVSVVTWRGDGLYFAVGYVADSISHFKVYNREGILQYTGEKQPGLECKFSWRPTGNLIASTQAFPNKYVVAFFEKNGLKHGELVLPFKYGDVSVRNISWSSDSEVLNVWYTDNSTLDNHVLLYTINNYHWYLKQSLVFPAASQILVAKWEDNLSDNNGKCLNVILNDGVHEKIEWIWSIDQSNGKNEADDSVVGVIDGNKILLNTFRYSVVPPPMSSTTIECKSNVNRIIFGPKNGELTNDNYVIDSNSFCAFMDNGHCAIYVKDTKRTFKLLENIAPDFLKNASLALNNMLWLSRNCLIWIESNGSSSVVSIINLSFDPQLMMTVQSSVQVNDNIIGLRAIPNTDKAVLQTDSGKLLLFLSNQISDFDVSFPEHCSKFDIVSMENEYFAFGLTPRNRFYINDLKVANNVTSYFVHSDFLLLTTLQHQLLSCPLTNNDMKNLQSKNWFENYDHAEQNGYFMSRRIERGAYLVAAVPCDARTILQLPRGNLEIIQPRALLLKIIGEFLNKNNYDLAFNLMRKERINLNLMYDHDPDTFTKNISTFITKVNNPNWLSLFISDLDNQDVTTTMYLGAYKNKSANASASQEGKVRMVCEKVRVALEEINENNKYLLPILTTYVKNNTVNDLETALIKIKHVKDKDNERDLVSANDALKYLLYMVNVDELYNIALGLYDFDLVMFVANKSQKDPKEYMPYINNLKSMETNYRKFVIDKDLKRYESALKHLIECGDDKSAELLQFIKLHCLYGKALNQIPSTDIRYKSIAEEFGNFLISKRHYTEAAMMYLRSDKIEKAIDCFTEALEWQFAINLANRSKFPDENILSLKKKLLIKLKEAKRYSDVVCLLSENSNVDVDQVLKYALEGKLYKLSLNVCQKYQKEDLIDSLVKPAVLEQSKVLLTTVNQNMVQFQQWKDRLLVVRQNKAAKLAEIEDCNLPLDCDLYSDTSSIAGSSGTRTSGRSHRSSKNRRKHERKMASLKEGSRFEDIGLVRALHTLVSTTFNMREDVAEIGFALQWLSLDDEIQQLQTTLDKTLNHMTKHFSIIWIPELNTETQVDLKVQDITTILDASFSLEPHLRIPPVIQEIKWKIEYL